MNLYLAWGFLWSRTIYSHITSPTMDLNSCFWTMVTHIWLQNELLLILFWNESCVLHWQILFIVHTISGTVIFWISDNSYLSMFSLFIFFRGTRLFFPVAVGLNVWATSPDLLSVLAWPKFVNLTNVFKKTAFAFVGFLIAFACVSIFDFCFGPCGFYSLLWTYITLLSNWIPKKMLPYFRWFCFR